MDISLINNRKNQILYDRITEGGVFNEINSRYKYMKEPYLIGKYKGLNRCNTKDPNGEYIFNPKLGCILYKPSPINEHNKNPNDQILSVKQETQHNKNPNDQILSVKQEMQQNSNPYNIVKIKTFQPLDISVNTRLGNNSIPPFVQHAQQVQQAQKEVKMEQPQQVQQIAPPIPPQQGIPPPPQQAIPPPPQAIPPPPQIKPPPPQIKPPPPQPPNPDDLGPPPPPPIKKILTPEQQKIEDQQKSAAIAAAKNREEIIAKTASGLEKRINDRVNRMINLGLTSEEYTMYETLTREMEAKYKQSKVSASKEIDIPNSLIKSKLAIDEKIAKKFGLTAQEYYDYDLLLMKLTDMNIGRKKSLPLLELQGDEKIKFDEIDKKIKAAPVMDRNSDEYKNLFNTLKNQYLSTSSTVAQSGRSVGTGGYLYVPHRGGYLVYDLYNKYLHY